MHPYLELFQKNNLQGNIRIHKERSKNIEYIALHDEVILKSDENTYAVITIIKNERKINIRVKDISPSAIENIIKKHFALLEKITPDADNNPLPIIDSVESNFLEFNYSEVDKDFLLSQWEKVKNFPQETGMKIENF